MLTIILTSRQHVYNKAIMKKPLASQAGFIPMLIMLLLVLVAVIVFVFLRVEHAQTMHM